MPTYLELSRAAADLAAARVVALYGTLHSGGFTGDDFTSAASITVRQAAAQVASLADFALTTRLRELTGTQPSPLGLTPPEPHPVEAELRKALAAPDVATALTVATNAQVYSAGQWAWSKGLVEHKVPGWRRVTSGGGCSMCANLAAAPFLPSRITMLAHKGCACHPDPVMEAPDEVSHATADRHTPHAGAGHGVAGEHLPGRD